MPFIEIDDLKLYYEIQGSGPRLLFHPGTASDLRSHPNIFDSPLVKHFEVLAFDPRGIGQSNSPNPTPTMLDYATDIKHVLDAVGWDRCHLIGESFGGMVAQEFAINFQDYLDKLVLVVTSSGGAGGASYPYHKHDLAKLSDNEKADLWVRCADTRMADPEWKNKNPACYNQQFQAYYKVFESNKNNPNQATFSARQLNARKGHDTYNRLNKIKAETYICGAQYDKTAPIKNQLAMLENINHARLSLFNGSHMILWQDPFAFTSIISFLKESKF